MKISLSLSKLLGDSRQPLFKMAKNDFLNESPSLASVNKSSTSAFLSTIKLLLDHFVKKSEINCFNLEDCSVDNKKCWKGERLQSGNYLCHNKRKCALNN